MTAVENNGSSTASEEAFYVEFVSKLCHEDKREKKFMYGFQYCGYRCAGGLNA
jgi:hypothetical protein